MNTSVSSKVENNKFRINYDVTADWNNGYTANISFTNKGNSFKDWTMTFESEREIDKIWNAELVSRDGNKYTVKAVDWNDHVRNWETTTFGFRAKGDDNLTPSNFTLNGQSIGGNSQPSNPTPNPNPAPTPRPTSAPNQPSSNAIVQSFEGHSNGTVYDHVAQKKDWNLLWSQDARMKNFAKITNSEAYSGNNSLRITHSPTQASGGGAVWEIPGKDVYYLQYKVKFEAGYDFNGRKYSGGKLPGLTSTDGQASGGQDANGSNGYTTRYMWRENGQAEAYVYHMDKPGQWGESFDFKDVSGQDVYFKPGEWHELTQRVEINDGNQKNGSLDVWMDGQQVLNIDNLRFVNNGSKVDAVYFSNFHGGSGPDWYPDKESHIYFDDFVVSTNPADVGV
ncbi:conserved hypothetical protein [Hyella patelloides LEGE 07179]|uniref:CBM2 domain-containing protein n=1 Tax=Hyella patelloides LEGE 07179 TaxID=945734 RepID=A0A563VRV4_9CYAN|nr:cellulose binding domain-containing protein [Hyella patelloides]VEP14188.1 conserved hypothetical protein [Hyella patelloides LEGE 07179]